MFVSRAGISPIRADGLFPRVCVDKDFSYENIEDPLTQLKALQDAEQAFRLYSSCRYYLPNNFSHGIDKISAIVGTAVERENVRHLRTDFEVKLGLKPAPPSSLLGRIKGKVLRAFDL